MFAHVWRCCQPPPHSLYRADLPATPCRIGAVVLNVTRTGSGSKNRPNSGSDSGSNSVPDNGANIEPDSVSDSVPDNEADIEPDSRSHSGPDSGNNRGSDSGSDSGGESSLFDFIVSMEDLSKGQRIANYSIEYRRVPHSHHVIVVHGSPSSNKIRAQTPPHIHSHLYPRPQPRPHPSPHTHTHPHAYPHPHPYPHPRPHFHIAQTPATKMPIQTSTSLSHCINARTKMPIQTDTPHQDY